MAHPPRSNREHFYTLARVVNEYLKKIFSIYSRGEKSFGEEKDNKVIAVGRQCQ
jgi:hypothetical protein